MGRILKRINKHDRRLEGESGAFLVLYAVLVLALLAMVAIVIDLGQLRAVRRTSQSVSDFAALAAGTELGRTTGGSAVVACQDAVDYVVKNAPDFPTGASVPCGDLVTATPTRVPCSNDPTVTPPLVLHAVAEAPYVLQVVYPVPDTMISDPRRGGAGENDGNQCERMQVRLSKTGDTLFSQVFGMDSLTQGAKATARGFIQSEGQDNPALVILELEACGALQASGQGGVEARGNGIKPGIIAVASAGSASPGGCTNNNNAGGKVVYGTFLPPSHPRPGEPSIRAYPAEAPDPIAGVPLPPILRVYAMDTPNSARAAYDVPTGVFPAPQGGPRVNRNPVDARYGPGIADLAITAGNPPGTYRDLSTILASGCRVTTTNFRVTEANVRINCQPQFTGGAAADEIVFTGSNFVSTVNLSITKKWTFSDPSLIVIDRDDDTKPAIDINTTAGQLWVNTGTGLTDYPSTPLTLPDDYCGPNRNGSGFGTVRFVVTEGDFNARGSSDSIKLCQTTVYMAHGAASPRPDNENNTDQGFVSFGGGKTDWTAPDQTNQPPCRPPILITGCYDSTASNFLLEDLALWTESAPLSNIGGTGEVFLTGVFFLPNATFRFTGQALQDIVRNAQFVARKLDMAGKGSLNLRPDPNESVAFLSAVSILIR
ncbi:MAG: pilus assembly protein TadG-related protein [Acidimicrobiales bacterium]